MKRALTVKAALLVGALLLSACGGVVRKLGPVEPVEFDRHGWSGADLTLRIGNGSAHDLRIRAAKVTFYYDEAFIGTATLMRETVVPKRSHDLHRTRWRLRVEDPAAAMLLLKRIETHDYDRIAVEYAFTAKVGIVRRTFSADMVPLSIFLATFEPVIDLEP